MSDDSDGSALLPGLLASGVQQAGTQAADTQRQLLRRFLGANGPPDLGDHMDAVAGTATFKARVQRSGRVSIPDAEREALDIREGDIVQTVIVPVERERDQETRQ